MTGYVCIAQQLSGIVTDGLNKEPIPGAKIELKDLQVATYTDAEGRFNLKGDWPESILLQALSLIHI